MSQSWHSKVVTDHILQVEEERRTKLCEVPLTRMRSYHRKRALFDMKDKSMVSYALYNKTCLDTMDTKQDITPSPFLVKDTLPTPSTDHRGIQKSRERPVLTSTDINTKSRDSLLKISKHYTRCHRPPVTRRPEWLSNSGHPIRKIITGVTLVKKVFPCNKKGLGLQKANPPPPDCTLTHDASLRDVQVSVWLYDD